MISSTPPTKYTDDSADENNKPKLLLQLDDGTRGDLGPFKKEESVTDEQNVGHRNFAKGIVREIGYLGDMSIYHIELESGKRVQAAVTNLLRLTERDVKWEDEVYLYWRAENGIVLTG
jgi:ABC-type Fe3+/spermidine/putrescine transport system ATPase subunit